MSMCLVCVVCFIGIERMSIDVGAYMCWLSHTVYYFMFITMAFQFPQFINNDRKSC